MSYKQIVLVHAGSVDICVSGVWKQSSVNLCRLWLIFFYTLSRLAQQRTAIKSSRMISSFSFSHRFTPMGCYMISGEVKHNKLHLFDEQTAIKPFNVPNLSRNAVLTPTDCRTVIKPFIFILSSAWTCQTAVLMKSRNLMAVNDTRS